MSVIKIGGCQRKIWDFSKTTPGNGGEKKKPKPKPNKKNPTNNQKKQQFQEEFPYMSSINSVVVWVQCRDDLLSFMGEG